MADGSAEETVFAGRRFRVVRLVESAADGSRHVREVVRHPGAVAIVPLVDGQSVCLVRNHRCAVGSELIELPAGTLEPGEPPAATAHRELAEETGYRAGRMELLAEFYTSPGILDERMYLYLATELVPGPAAPEPGERLQPIVVAWDEAMAMLRRGEIRDAKTLAGLLYYDALRRRG